MPGPKPKDPELRQRTNKASTAAELPAPDASRKAKVPPLTKDLLGFKKAVRPQVQRWWREAWSSPMASRWLGTDIEVLYVCAQIRQQIAIFIDADKSIATLASELRQQEGRVGLDVMARRRLDWRIEGPRPEAVAPEPSPAPVSREPENFDPRSVLRAV